MQLKVQEFNPMELKHSEPFLPLVVFEEYIAIILFQTFSLFELLNLYSLFLNLYL
jgi:hypothetical protein